jgi:phenylalanyl-tRNA synthetase beta subunit
MRAYIFTNVERKILKDYILRGRKTRHFNVIASLIRKNEGNLLKDIALIETYKKKNRKTKTSKGR